MLPTTLGQDLLLIGIVILLAALDLMYLADQCRKEANKHEAHRKR